MVSTAYSRSDRALRNPAGTTPLGWGSAATPDARPNWSTTRRPMTRFTASNKSAASLKSSRKEVWSALTDPELLPKLTPYLNRIDVDGDRWTWNVTKVPVLGKSLGTTFTEVMAFEEPDRIAFTHDEARSEENSGVEGEYLLEEDGSGCR